MVNKKGKKLKRKKKLQIPKAQEEESMIESMAKDDLTNFTKRRSLRDTVYLLRQQKAEKHLPTNVVSVMRNAPFPQKMPNAGQFQLNRQVTEQLTSQEIQDLHLVFDFFDRDNNGSIDTKELRSAFKVLGFKLTQDEARRMLLEIDGNKSGDIQFNEFLEFIISRQNDTRDIHAEITRGFKILDEDKDGFINLRDLQRAAREVELDLSMQELKDMLEEADKNGDGYVDFQEFVNVMLKTNLFL